MPIKRPLAGLDCRSTVVESSVKWTHRKLKMAQIAYDRDEGSRCGRLLTCSKSPTRPRWALKAISRRPATGRNERVWPVRSRISANPGLPYRTQSGKFGDSQKRAFDTLDAESLGRPCFGAPHNSAAAREIDEYSERSSPARLLIVRQRAEAAPWRWPGGGSRRSRPRRQRAG